VKILTEGNEEEPIVVEKTSQDAAQLQTSLNQLLALLNTTKDELQTIGNINLERVQEVSETIKSETSQIEQPQSIKTLEEERGYEKMIIIVVVAIFVISIIISFFLIGASEKIPHIQEAMDPDL